MTKFVNATSPSTRWNSETILVSLDSGILVDVHPHSTLSLQRWAEPQRIHKFENNGEIGSFSFLRGDIIHRIGKFWRLRVDRG